MEPNVFQLPLLSRFRFGNETFANMGHSSATLSGNVPGFQNQDFAMFEPVRFTFPSSMNDDTPIRAGDMNLPEQILPPGQRPSDNLPTAAADTGENRLIHLFKMQFVAMIALVLLAIGLYILSQQTETGQKIQGKVLEAAEVASLA